MLMLSSITLLDLAWVLCPGFKLWDTATHNRWHWALNPQKLTNLEFDYKLISIIYVLFIYIIELRDNKVAHTNFIAEDLCVTPTCYPVKSTKSSSPSPSPWRIWPICDGKKSRPCLLKLINWRKKWVGFSSKPALVRPSSFLAPTVVTNPSELIPPDSDMWPGGIPK